MVASSNLPGMGAPIVDANGFVTAWWRSFFVNIWNRTGGSQDIVQTNSYIGEVRAYGGSAAPASWAICDGTYLNRVDYSGLFAVIGTNYGVGDGSTTFALPDFRGRALLGAGAAPGLTARSLGDTGGAESDVLTSAQMPSHTHTVTDPGHAHGISDPGHTHTTATTATNGTAGSAAGAVAGNTGTSTTGITVNSATTGITLANTGGADPVSRVQPFGVVNYIIRVQ